MKPLAYLMRPTKFSDIVGQDHLVGENGVITRMIKNNDLFTKTASNFFLYLTIKHPMIKNNNAPSHLTG